MTTISTKPPSGMRDFLSEDVARRRHVTGVIQRVYESFGFVPLETPTIENLSTLLGKYGPEGDQLLYRILHRRERLARALATQGVGEADLSDEGLRYDLTVPLARVVANYRDLPAFYKRYQIQPVWRADRPARGRFREFYQCDVDITGTASSVADAEVCSAIATVLEELGFGEFKILLNHRELLRGLVADAGIAPELEGSVLIAIDKLDKIGWDGVHKELAERGVDIAAVARVESLLADAKSAGFLERTAARAGEDATSLGARALLRLLDVASQTRAAAHLSFDPTLARGLSYYTGPIFEVAVSDLAGSLGGGGRYDGLIGMFQKKSVPAVGFSLGLERILLVMEERGMFPPLALGPEVLLCRLGDAGEREALGLATRLRAKGLRVEVYAESHALGKQLQYATTVGARFAAIVGAKELERGVVALKDLERGTQEDLGEEQVAARVRAT